MNDKVFKLLGSHGSKDRAVLDFYSTDPIALTELLKQHTFNNVWECAGGNGDLVDIFKSIGVHGKASDIKVRRDDIEELDFLKYEGEKWDGDIVTNPPFCVAEEFVEKAIETVVTGRQVGMFLRIQFLESAKRRELFKKYPLKYVYVASSRIQCHKDGINQGGSGAMCYAWFIWEKGYQGETTLKWFN